MQQIKAAVGEDDAAAIAFVAGKPQNRLLQCEDGIQKGLRASAAGTNRETGSCSLSRACVAARSTRRAGSESVSDYPTNQACRLFRSGLLSTRDLQLAPTSSVNL